MKILPYIILFLGLVSSAPVLSSLFAAEKNQERNIESNHEKSDKEMDNKETDSEGNSSPFGMFKSYADEQQRAIDRGEHFIINTLVGTFSGMAFGAMFSFSDFVQHDYARLGLTGHEENAKTIRGDHNKDNLVFYLGIGGLSGALGGMLVTLFELNDPQPFMLGLSLLDFTWYGALAGYFIGALYGVIPYSSDKLTDHIYNYAGYTSAAGLGVGIILWVFFRPEKTVKNFSVSMNQDQLQLGYRWSL